MPKTVADSRVDGMPLQQIMRMKREIFTAATGEGVKDGTGKFKKNGAGEKARASRLKLFGEEKFHLAARAKDLPQRDEEAEGTRRHDAAAHGVEIKPIPGAEFLFGFCGANLDAGAEGFVDGALNVVSTGSGITNPKVVGIFGEIENVGGIPVNADKAFDEAIELGRTRFDFKLQMCIVTRQVCGGLHQ